MRRAGTGAGRIDYLLGLDAGGILPTVGLALIGDLPYKIAWKLRLPLPGTVHFVEPHATRPDVYAYGIETGRRVLLVGDEVTTRYTLANLAARLREAGSRTARAGRGTGAAGGRGRSATSGPRR